MNPDAKRIRELMENVEYGSEDYCILDLALRQVLSSAPVPEVEGQVVAWILDDSEFNTTVPCQRKKPIDQHDWIEVVPADIARDLGRRLAEEENKRKAAKLLLEEARAHIEIAFHPELGWAVTHEEHEWSVRAEVTQRTRALDAETRAEAATQALAEAVAIAWMLKRIKRIESPHGQSSGFSADSDYGIHVEETGHGQAMCYGATFEAACLNALRWYKETGIYAAAIRGSSEEPTGDPFDCVACGVHIERYGHGYAPVCLKCKVKKPVVDMDALRVRFDAWFAREWPLMRVGREMRDTSFRNRMWEAVKGTLS